jgi:hypothetical protein
MIYLINNSLELYLVLCSHETCKVIVGLVTHVVFSIVL